MGLLGNLFDYAGTALHLPEWGISEKLGSTGTTQPVMPYNPLADPLSSQSLARVLSGQTPVNQDGTQTTQTTTNTGGSVLGSGTTAQAAPPPPDLTPYKNDVNSRIGQLQGLYGQLFGQVDQNVNDQRNQYDKGYNSQQSQLGNDYQGSMGQIGQIMAGRGLADSSYLGDAQGQATNQYNTGLDQLNQGRDNAYANLGKFATTYKQQLGSGQSQLGQIDLSQYTDPNQLVSLRNQLDSQLASLQSTQAGLGTNAQYQNDLQATTPAAQQAGSAALAAQLQKLKSSGASPLITGQIAQGLIKSAGKQNDPYIQNLWQSLSAQ